MTTLHTGHESWLAAGGPEHPRLYFEAAQGLVWWRSAYDPDGPLIHPDDAHAILADWYAENLDKVLPDADLSKQGGVWVITKGRQKLATGPTIPDAVHAALVGRQRDDQSMTR